MNGPLSEKKVLNAGLVALTSVHGSDRKIASTARTSYRNDKLYVDPTKDAALIDYMVRHDHATPFEFAGAVFYMVMPIFVARQMVRHRTAAINEESLRYVEAREEIYIPTPEECKAQSITNKQGSGDLLDFDTSKIVIDNVKNHNDNCRMMYSHLLSLGLSKELSRSVLPLGQYTAWYWKANLRNVFHLLELRLDPHAQPQCRVYAEAMLELLEPHFPMAFASWKNHKLNVVTFSADEWKIIKAKLGYSGKFVGEFDPSVLVKELGESRAKKFMEKINNG